MLAPLQQSKTQNAAAKRIGKPPDLIVTVYAFVSSEISSGPTGTNRGLAVNLKEFVEETLNEILEGIRAAQNKDGGTAVGALTSAALTHGNVIALGATGYLAIIDFDVSVAAEAGGGGKGGIRVMSIGVEGGGQFKYSETSRVKFSVPVVLPKGCDEAVKRFNRPL